MQAIYTRAIEDESALFAPLPQPPFAARLWRALTDAAREFARGPLVFLRRAFLPEHMGDWLPARFGKALAWFAAHPLAVLGGLWQRERIPVGFINPRAARSASFVVNASAPTVAKLRAWDRFVPVLVGSGAAHGALIILLVYLTIRNMLAPFTDVKIVNQPYRPFTEDQIAQLYARKITQPKPTDQVLSLEELRERERKRREELERRRKEEEERLKAEREKAEREAKAAEEKAKAEAAAKEASNGPMQFGTINEAAIKDMIAKMFESYKNGELDAGNYAVRLGFRINCDGSMPRESIRLLPWDKATPPDPKKENLAKQILWLIGESHAVGSLCQFSSNSIDFEMNDEITRLSITGFGPTPEWTNEKAMQLKTLFLGISLLKGNTDTGQLAKLVKIHTTSKRLDLDLTISRERANEMMRASQRSNPQ
ncbi:MAG TPA: hypothetical protein VKA60_01165 [Blastocatellia bacterium]|nr:hypothetical protein [Blastocatellia bacterium]